MDQPRSPDDDFEINDESQPPTELAMFPLPNVVLFPNMLLPLHIFEQRYRLMLNDCLVGNRLLGMVLMKKGWEEASGDPEPYDVGCMGRVAKVVKLVNGNMNILLNGLLRVRVNGYVRLKPYRIASITPLYDDAVDDPEADALAQECKANFLRLVSMRHSEAREFQQLKLLDSPLDIANFLGAHVQADYHVKQMILECDSGRERLQTIAHILKSYLGMLN
ncbi:MAG: LON peptidase substrate-binding domain-containing protein [Candidatus Tectomicrobia bacterium]|nr:LON peptidase substrate-binding domain-containing protein [Candidatus Tectomicrobia bacterium]